MIADHRLMGGTIPADVGRSHRSYPDCPSDQLWDQADGNLEAGPKSADGCSAEERNCFSAKLKFRAHCNLVVRVGAHRSLIGANRSTELGPRIDELRPGRLMLQPDRLSATLAKLWPAGLNTSLSLNFCDCHSDAFTLDGGRPEAY
ncbi:hypothetical protein QA649_36615 [Bradyrhizobium sp. CB1717]|uniref:hypothetical protein n=1 Tax=Bradyrhizobium sp. CB1717 TaxID=3039154 RepID=UPI0024B0B9BA|nr:hypothetical protein [Bradyrhizobium sp. CB1717]WFU23498.1 hypothetical protein QA649_36615 [Bradyrhizobium sp. CB1717]